MLKVEDTLSVKALRVAAIDMVNEEMNRWRHFASLQMELQRALSSNRYLIWVLQYIARCRKDLLYSSCDTLDLEVAREGVEYEDELVFSHKPLVDYRLEHIQNMSLHEKRVITSHLCLLGYKVTHSGDDLGQEYQLQCPMLVDFDLNTPPTPTAQRYKWKVFKPSGYVNIMSPATKQYIKSLQALCVVTNAKTYEKFHHLMTIIQKRQHYIKYVTSSIFCLWSLELFINLTTQLSYSEPRCLHVHEYIVASAGVGMMNTIEDTSVGTGCEGGDDGDDTNSSANNSEAVARVDHAREDEDASEDPSQDFFGDPLFFSRICRLEQMDSQSKRAAIPFLRQFCNGWRLCRRGDGSCAGRDFSRHFQQEEEYLFSIVNNHV